jgi:transglutaminase-like putative cysteine protease
MTSRITIACVLLVAAVPGLLFAPVFGLLPLVGPIAAVLVTCYAVTELCRVEALAAWRPVLALIAGLAVLLLMLYGGSVPDFLVGITNSWQLTLESTWPVHPDPAMLLFVPVAVLLAVVVGVELLRWPVLALVPSVLVLVLSQLYQAASGVVATVTGLGYAVIAGALLAFSRRRPDVPVSGTGVSAGRLGTALLAVPTIVLAVVFAAGLTAVDQGRQPAFSLHQNHSAPVQLTGVVNPLDQVAQRLKHPDQTVFQYRASGPVDRWRLVVLDQFNGVSWSSDDQYQWMGTDVGPPSMITVPTSTRSAWITVPPTEPWLPSQPVPATVDGLTPAIDPSSGMLVVTDRGTSVSYDLSWREPQVGVGQLANATLVPNAVPAGDLGVVPPEVAALAQKATAGQRPSFQTALLLERYLSDNYHLATGADLPTGNGWPQLRDFLITTKRGTSEQFAASYVALARIVGIPARLAVGYRAPKASDGTVVVHNGDVLAWPEVAVAGVGWVPLDPSGTASATGTQPTGLAKVADQARQQLPPHTNPPEPPLPPTPVSTDPGFPVIWLLWVLCGLVGLAVLAFLAVPLVKLVRTWRRRRRTGSAGVVAAWAEARDLLRARGVAVTAGMTVRDLAVAAGSLDRSVVDGLNWLAQQVDIALWSGLGADRQTVAQAWSAVGAVRRGLSGPRLGALFDPRDLVGSLLPTSRRGHRAESTIGA